MNFNKKTVCLKLYVKNVYLKQINIFIEMVKTDSRQIKAYFFKFRGDENLKQQWLIKRKRRDIQSIQHDRMCHAYRFV